MAFTGVPIIEQISDRTVRITGVSLAAAATGALGLFGTTVPGAVALPDGFNPKEYDYAGNLVSQVESLRVSVNAVAAPDVPRHIAKVGSNETLSIAITNEDAQNASGALEIYVTFRD